MDALQALIDLISQVKRNSQEGVDRGDLKGALQRLEDLRKAILNHSAMPAELLGQLRADIQRLEDSRFLEGSEHARLIAEVRAAVQKYLPTVDDPSTATPDSSSSSNRYTIFAPQAHSQPLPGFPSNVHVLLPKELAESLTQSHFLHLLATDPGKVLPPGKSILSMMSQSHRDPSDRQEGSLPTLPKIVEDIAHKAFWDEAVDSLSSSEPSSQLRRIKALYTDLHAAVTPLLPPHHPVLVTLASQLSPTPSPLRSATIHVREVASALRERCAPARDPALDCIMQALDNPPPDVSRAGLIVDAVKSILEIAEVMKSDLSQFIMGAMSEKQLRGVIRQEAKAKERALVLQLWSLEEVRRLWSEWLGELSQPLGDAVVSKWILGLFQALTSTHPVSSKLPTSLSIVGKEVAHAVPSPMQENALPPLFLHSIPSLLYLQDYLQALVIAASLRSLTFLTQPSHRNLAPQTTTARPGPAADFMDRVWALLRAELDEEEGADTRLTNLADEVVRARMLATGAPGLDADGEARLRAAVERTLQPTDPVYVLLQKRLVAALCARLTDQQERRTNVLAPAKMQTGRDGERAQKRPRLIIQSEEVDLDDTEHAQPEPPLTVKGFEDPVLVKSVTEALKRLRTDVQWISSVWEDVVCGEENAYE